MLILISSAHRRAGLLYDRWKSHYGTNNEDVLVVRGTTLQFNPRADRKLIEKRLAEDPPRYQAEFEQRIVIDCVVAKNPPFNPSSVIEEISALLKTYRISQVTGDNYAAEYTVEAFAKQGITYRRSKLDRSEIYLCSG
jgi:hypothetical protein